MTQHKEQKPKGQLIYESANNVKCTDNHKY